MAKKFDVYEQRALEAVASKIPPESFTFPAKELPSFLQWLVQEFGEAIRKEVESGRAPF